MGVARRSEREKRSSSGSRARLSGTNGAGRQQLGQLGARRPSGLRRPRRRRSGTGRRGRRGSSGRGGRRRRRRSAPAPSGDGATPIDADLLGELATRRRRRRSRRRRRRRRRPMSQRPGQRSLSVAAAVDEQLARRSTITTTNTARWRSRSARIRRRVTVATTRSSLVDDVDELVAEPVVHGPCLPWPDDPRHASLREEANDLLEPDRRAAPDAARVAGGRQRAAGHPRARAGGDRGPAARRHDARDDQRHRRHADRRRAGPDDPAARRHGRPAAARGHRARLHARASTTRCTPAATTPTRRCSSARRRLLAGRRDDLAGRVLFMFQPGEEGHHGARFMLEEGLLDVPAAGRRHAVAGHRRVRHPHHVVAAVGVAEQPRRLDHGVGRHADDHDHRQGRPRQRAAPGDRPDPGRLRDRAGAADDGHPHGRRVRPVGGHGRAASRPARRTT